MTAITQQNDDSQSRSAELAVQATEEFEAKRPTLSVGRIIIGTGVATGAALVAVFAGLPVLAATALGAGVGGSAVAMLAAHASPLRR